MMYQVICNDFVHTLPATTEQEALQEFDEYLKCYENQGLFLRLYYGDDLVLAMSTNRTPPTIIEEVTWKV